MRDCPESEELARLLQGTLPDDRVALIEPHLAQCERCARLVERIAQEDDIGRAAREGMSSLIEADHPLVQQTIQRLLAAHSVAKSREQSGDRDLSGDYSETELLSLNPPLEAGELGRLGDYRLLKILGRGGMGIVFHAEDIHLRRSAAVKVMSPRLAASSEARERFLREARATAALKHDHIVTIYQVGGNQEGGNQGTPYLAMELLAGMSLEQLLEQLPAKGQQLDVPSILRIGRELCLGLAAAHSRGLIHRDIKPANIWLEPRGDEASVGRVKILDFGLARFETEDTALTAAGSVMGTPAYMSPEQARGEAVDARSDLFSVGCLLYRMAAGANPFQGKSHAAIFMELATVTPRPLRELNPEISPAFSDLVRQLLAKNPSERPESAAHVERQLAGLEQKRTAAPSATRRSRRVTPLVIGLVLATTGAAVVGLIRPWEKAPVEEIRSPVAPTAAPEQAATSTVPVQPEEAAPIVVSPPEENEPAESASGVAASPFDSLNREQITGVSGEELERLPAELVGVLRQDISGLTGDAGFGLAISPDGRSIAYCFGGSQVLSWDVATRETRSIPLPPYVGLNASCKGLEFAPDGESLAHITGRSACHCTIWNTKTEKPLRNFQVMGVAARQLTSSPANESFVGLDYGGTLWDWNWRSGEERRIATGIFAPVVSCASTRKIAGMMDKKIALLDLESGEPLWSVEGTPRGLSFRPDGGAIAAVDSPQGTVTILNAADGLEVKSWSASKDVIESVAYSPDGKLLAIRGSRGTIHLLDPEAKSTLRKIELKVRGHLGSIVFSPDGRHLAAANRDGTVYIVRLASPAASPGLEKRS